MLRPHAAPTVVEVFRELGPFVWRALRRLGVSEADADDACQEVFLVVHRRLAEFEGRSSLSTWVYGICARTASDFRRRAYVRREVVTAALPELEDARTPDHDLELRRACAALDAILAGLDEDRRAVFVLYEIEGLTMLEVAEALECPLQTAYSRLYAARRDVVAAAKRRERGVR